MQKVVAFLRNKADLKNKVGALGGKRHDYFKGEAHSSTRAGVDTRGSGRKKRVEQNGMDQVGMIERTLARREEGNRFEGRARGRTRRTAVEEKSGCGGLQEKGNDSRKQQLE